MSNNYNNIDDLLRESFDDFSSAPSPELRAKVSVKVRHFNFFKFNPWSFNIFYLAAIVLGTTAIISFSTGAVGFNNETPVSEKSTKTEERKSEETKTVLELPLTNTENKSVEKEIIKNDIANNQVILNQETKNVSNTSSNIIESNLTKNSNVSLLVQNEINTTNSATTEKTIIFDTIVETVKILVVDTVKTEVHRTVEVKKNRNNKK
jgi:DNA-binding transcriptional regulator YbjK